MGNVIARFLDGACVQDLVDAARRQSVPKRAKPSSAQTALAAIEALESVATAKVAPHQPCKGDGSCKDCKNDGSCKETAPLPTPDKPRKEAVSRTPNNPRKQMGTLGEASGGVLVEVKKAMSRAQAIRFSKKG